MALPLDGIKVVDISTAYAGPFCSMFLADMGAEVIKVERPGSGDDTRGWGPPFIGTESAWFLSTNRNKKSMTLNIGQAKGKAILIDLVRGADVILENMKPSTVDKLGLGYDILQPINPRLVYCAISGFGMTGPWRNEPGYDLIAQALGGIMSVTGETGGRPQKVGTALSDITAGMIASFAISSALYGRERTGRGEFIDISLLEGQLAVMTPRLVSYLMSGIEPQPASSTDSPITLYQPVPTADRDIVVATGTERLWESFCKATGLGELLADSRFASNKDRTTNKNSLLPIVESVMRTMPSDYWLAQLRDAGVPCALIQHLSEVVNHIQVKGRDMIVDVEHPLAGNIKLVAPPWRLASGSQTVTPPPILGQHTDEILSQVLGYGERELADLRKERAI